MISGQYGSRCCRRARRRGGHPSGSRRQLIDGIRFRVRTGIPWRDVPAEYGPWGRIHDLFRPHVDRGDAGRRGDSPQFEPVLRKFACSARIGAGRPRVRPDRGRADKAYASRKNRAHLRRREIRCTIPDRSDRARNRRWLGSRGGRPPRFDPADYRAPRGRVRDQPPQEAPRGRHAL
ncbi:transposase [Streptomyces sp. NPDC053720]|uniref:transposase n=1 Tax=Streptomyces sp. NPDC053720 TaxID=3154855 RepID=UPI00343F7460